MHSIYLSNLRNFFRSKQYRIGFMIPDWAKPYNMAMASTRIRVYDIIECFDNDKAFLLELWNPLRRYDAVVFQKLFSEKALTLAEKLRSDSTKVILDVNVNYYDANSKYVSKNQYRDICEFTAHADAIITTTKYIRDCARKLFPRKTIVVIGESINDSYFRFRKDCFASERGLVWAGYAKKASEVLLIDEVLTELHRHSPFRMLLICEKDPEINIGSIPIVYLKYDQTKIARQLIIGDIFIAPRDLSDSYNLSHSFTKIGTAMAAGLPVIASPVPSYLDSPAVICRNRNDWLRNLKTMLKDNTYLQQLSAKGVQYVRTNYNISRIRDEYRSLFNALLG